MEDPGAPSSLSYRQAGKASTGILMRGELARRGARAPPCPARDYLCLRAACTATSA
jgi:hypothetical protein